MDNYCRGCLTQYESSELIQYTEKNRRLFVYSTGLQVKRNDAFIFQLCEECYNNMKAACNFKKNCRNSDKKLKSYLENKESGENLEFSTYAQNYDDSLKIRLPLNIGSSTPANRRNKDDDNESTCTSIQNFMNDILNEDEIPDNEARIISEVIEEEADILEDSLDSHWLQNDESIVGDFRSNASFSPFCTPRPIADAHFSPNKFNEICEEKITQEKRNLQSTENIGNSLNSDKSILNLFLKENFNKPDVKDEVKDNRCVIDFNLENALNNSAKKVMLDDILKTPPVISNILSPPTPLITKYFHDRIDDIIRDTKDEYNQEFDNKVDIINTKDENNQEFHNKIVDTKKDTKDKSNQEKHDIIHHKTKDIKEKNDREDIEALDKFLINDSKAIDNFDDSLMDLEDMQTYFSKQTGSKTESPSNGKYCVTNFYCKMCNRKFKNLVALKVHFTKNHKFKIEKKKKQYVCDYCERVFNSATWISRHLANHHKKSKIYQCKKCSLKFTFESSLKMHMKTHVGERTEKSVSKSKSFVCSVCGAMFKTSSNLYTHMRRHDNNYTVNCDECGRGFYRMTDLTVHIRSHTGERPYKCTSCTKSFSRQDILSRHMKLHIDEKPFPCQVCGAKFRTPFALKTHQTKTKSCLNQQNNIVTENSENIVNEILVTEAIVC